MLDLLSQNTTSCLDSKEEMKNLTMRTEEEGEQEVEIDTQQEGEAKEEDKEEEARTYWQRTRRNSPPCELDYSEVNIR